jgi:peroxiredoxin
MPKCRRAIFIMLALLFYTMAINVDASSKVGPRVNAFAPGFYLKSTQDETVTLKRVIAANKVTLVNFWATWCPPCRKEIPDLNRIYREFNKLGVEILAVNLQEDSEAVKAFKRENKMEFPILLDSEGKVGGNYQVYYIPTTFVIDRSGRIREIIQGGTSYTRLKEVISSLLKEEK